MGDLPVHWIDVPSKLQGKPKIRKYEYGGYVVMAPCSIVGENTYKPIEDYRELYETLNLIEEDDTKSDDAEIVGMKSLFTKGGALIRKGSKGLPVVRSKCVASSLLERENLCDLEVLEKADISYQIRMRYYKNKIYTYIGHILVAVNPYTELDFVDGPCAGSPLDTLDAIKVYHKGAYNNFKGLPPHIFAIAARAFVQCTDEKKNQSVIISGESGSGKTVTTKLVLKFLQAISSKNAAEGQDYGEDDEDAKETKMSIEEKIGCTNPILESFGNAKTLRNNNSSRFGKWMELLMHNGKILGASIEQYLLEKSRVVAPGKGERNYHIMYMVCEYLRRHANDPEAKWLVDMAESANLGYKLADYKQGTVNYLKAQKGDPVYEAEGWDDDEMFARVIEGFKSIGLWSHHKHIFAVVACVLHLGNIEFEGDMDKSQVASKSMPIVEHCAHLLQTDKEELASALTTNLFIVRGESTRTNQGKVKSEMSRDALAKDLYRSLFNWLVSQLSRKLHAPGDQELYSHVGVLDIFGFEDFIDENYFEQLCINYANERLQGNFNKHIFEEELKLYRMEEMPEPMLKRMAVDCPDNKKTLEMLKKMSDIINEGSNRNPMPNLRDKFVQARLQDLYGDEKKRSSSRRGSDAALGGGAVVAPFDLTSFREYFIVNHYAGPVEYRYKDMLERNNDKLLPSLKKAAMSSTSKFIAQLFSVGSEEGSVGSVGSEKKKQRTQKRGKALSSLIKTFGKSLNKLMKKLNAAQPHYVRCIKPNTLKLPALFQTNKVLEQMNSAGLFEAVKIRKSGFPFRVPTSNFIKNFGPAVDATPRGAAGGDAKSGDTDAQALKARAGRILALIGEQAGSDTLRADSGNVFVGKTAVLMRTDYWNKLNLFRQDRMRQMFLEAIESRSIPKLERAVAKAKALDMHFAEAVSAMRLLEFLRREEYSITTEIPSLMKLVDLDFFLSQRAGLKEQLTVNMAPISEILHANTLEGYFRTGGKKLEAAWLQLAMHEKALIRFDQYETRLAEAINKDSNVQMVATFSMVQKLEGLIKESQAMAAPLQARVAEDVEAARRLIAYLRKCKGLVDTLNDDSERAIDAIDDVVAHPEDAQSIQKGVDAVAAVEQALRELASEPLARVVGLKELDQTCVAITRDIAYAKIKAHCMQCINGMYRESKRLLNFEALESHTAEENERLAGRMLPVVLDMKVDLDELRGLDKLDFDLNLCAIRIVHQWAMARIENATRAEQRGLGNGAEQLREFKSWIVNLHLPENFKIDEIVAKCDERIEQLSESKAKATEQGSAAGAGAAAAAAAAGGLAVIADEKRDMVYELSPRRGENKTLPVSLVRTTSEAMLDEKASMHGNRRSILQAQANKLAAQLLPIQRELELTITRLDKIDEEEDDDLQVFQTRPHLPMSRIYQRALKNALHDGDLQDVSDIYKHLKELRAPIPSELDAAASKVHQRLSKVGSSVGVSGAFRRNIAVRNAYRDLVLHYRKLGDEMMSLKYCCLYRDARRAQLGSSDKEGKMSVAEIRASIA